MKSGMRYSATLILAALMLAGCGKEPAKGFGSTTISKWKSENWATSKAPMGLVLEESNAQITATLSELNGTNGFVLGDRLAVGNYQADQKAIVLMMGNLAPSLMPVEQWIANGGPYMKIPVEHGATNLAMTTVVKNGPTVTVNLVRVSD